VRSKAASQGKKSNVAQQESKSNMERYSPSRVSPPGSPKRDESEKKATVEEKNKHSESDNDVE
jgi:hypothetical protein